MGLVTFNVVFFTVMLILNAVINKKVSHDITGFKRESFLFTQLRRMKIKLKSNTFFTHPIYRLKRAVRKLRTLLVLKNHQKNKKCSIEGNPLKRKYRLSLIFFILFTIITHLLLVFNSNEDSNVKGIDVLFCFYSPLKDNHQCRDEMEWLIIRLLYLLGLGYVFSAVL